MPSTVIFGPGGTLGYIAADRVNAGNSLATLQKGGLKGDALVVQLRQAVGKAVTERLHEVLTNLTLSAFSERFKGRIPADQLSRAHLSNVKGAWNCWLVSALDLRKILKRFNQNN